MYWRKASVYQPGHNQGRRHQASSAVCRNFECLNASGRRTGLRRKESEGGEGLFFGTASLEAFLKQWVGKEKALKLH